MSRSTPSCAELHNGSTRPQIAFIHIEVDADGPLPESMRQQQMLAGGIGRSALKLRRVDRHADFDISRRGIRVQISAHPNKASIGREHGERHQRTCLSALADRFHPIRNPVARWIEERPGCQPLSRALRHVPQGFGMPTYLERNEAYELILKRNRFYQQQDLPLVFAVRFAPLLHRQ